MYFADRKIICIFAAQKRDVSANLACNIKKL